MGFSDEQRTDIFERTDGRCHLCFAGLVYANYGCFGARGAWEVEHSNPRANGGTNRLHNLYAACISCNRSKGIDATRRVRGWYGYRAAPFSTAKRAELRVRNALLGAVAASLVSDHLRRFVILGVAPRAGVRVAGVPDGARPAAPMRSGP